MSNVVTSQTNKFQRNFLFKRRIGANDKIDHDNEANSLKNHHEVILYKFLKMVYLYENDERDLNNYVVLANVK